MEKYTITTKQIVLFLLACLFASIIRLYWLTQVPPAVGGDELTYILTAKFMTLTGSDISGTWKPLSVFSFHYPTSYPQAEITYFLLAPVFALFPFSILTVKLFFAIISILIVMLIAAIAYVLFGTQVAIISAFIAAANPWLVFLGRTAYEMNPEVFFYLLSLLAVLLLSGKRIVLALPILAASFYSHIATKSIFVLFTGVISYIAYIHHKKRFQQYYVTLVALAAALTGWFLFSISHASSSRMSELISLSAPYVSESVDSLRKQTIANPLTGIYTNKITVVATTLIGKLFATLSPSYLFLTGDQFFSLYSHGLFYSIDALFLCLGIGLFLYSRKPIYISIVLLLFMSLIPRLLHSFRLENFTPQISLFFPFAILCISYGISHIWSIRGSYAPLLRIVIVGIYLVSVGNFVHTYFFQFPLQESFDFRVRVLSSYIARSSVSIDVYTHGPADVYSKYVFYSGAVNKKTASVITDAWNTKRYTLGHVTFHPCDDTDVGTGVVIVDESCKSLIGQQPSKAITRLRDAGATYRIVNDVACANEQSTPYAVDIEQSDFDVERLSLPRFCKQFIH